MIIAESTIIFCLYLQDGRKISPLKYLNPAFYFTFTCQLSPQNGEGSVSKIEKFS